MTKDKMYDTLVDILKKDKQPNIKWAEPIENGMGSTICDGDVRMVLLPVEVIFQYTDKIVSDYDEETGEIEYKSGFLMKVMPQDFEYKNQETMFMGRCLPNQKK